MILGIAGYARSGKTTIANMLSEELGVKSIAFADSLREFIYAANPMVDGMSERPVYLQEVIDRYGWNGAKSSIYADEIRRILQTFGTDAGRNILGDNIWIDLALSKVDGDTVIHDVRFINEADAIRENNGKIIRVVKRHVGPTNNHISEREMNNYEYDHIIYNNFNLNYLKDEVMDLWYNIKKDQGK